MADIEKIDERGPIAEQYILLQEARAALESAAEKGELLPAWK